MEKELIAKYMWWTECMSIQTEGNGFQLTQSAVESRNEKNTQTKITNKQTNK